jgi:hypothetical protein
MTELKPMYWNFDGLDVAFQGAIPQGLCDVLDQAKAEAQETRTKTLVEWRGECMHVAETGSKGGYAYICDTGPTGAIWFFSKNQKATNWNIFVSVRSNALASMGLGVVRAELYRFMEAIGAAVGDESISRVDYCLDFLGDEIAEATGTPFVLVPDAFVMHSHTSRSDHADDTDMQMHGVSGRYTSVTCGKIPGRQIIVYDKSTEVRRKQKHEWWAHWNAARDRQGLPPLTGQERIWRVELRAGKDHLKDRWCITTWEQLDNKLGDLLTHALSDIRYTLPSATDQERFRWGNHPLWEAVARTVGTDLADMTCGAEPGVVKLVQRNQLAQTAAAMIQGLTATYSVAVGGTVDATELGDQVGGMVRQHVAGEPVKFSASRKRAGQRYIFLDASQADAPDASYRNT